VVAEEGVELVRRPVVSCRVEPAAALTSAQGDGQRLPALGLPSSEAKGRGPTLMIAGAKESHGVGVPTMRRRGRGRGAANKKTLRRWLPRNRAPLSRRGAPWWLAALLLIAVVAIEGGGGGRADVAQAGGRRADKLDEALRLVPGLVRIQSSAP